eukprot:g63167.t1
MRKVKLGFLEAGIVRIAISAIPSTQHPRPLSPDPDPQATLIPSKAVLVSAEYNLGARAPLMFGLAAIISFFFVAALDTRSRNFF